MNCFQFSNERRKKHDTVPCQIKYEKIKFLPIKHLPWNQFFPYGYENDKTRLKKTFNNYKLF